MNDNNIDFSVITERIKNVIAKHGLTPKTFAEKVGENPSKLSHIFSGRNNPSLALVMKISQAFPDVRLDWLLGLDEKEDLPSPNSSQQMPTSGLLDFSERNEPEVSLVNVFERQPYTPQAASASVDTDAPKPVSKPKSIKKIIVFYSDNSFEEVVKDATSD